jgi:hypothetical protein
MGSIYRPVVKTDIAEKLWQDHEKLRAGLAKAMQEDAPVANAARRLAELCLPHFELEEKIVLPLLARLNTPASAEEGHEEIEELQAQIAELSRQRKRLESEHLSVAAAVDTLRDVANQHGSRETLELISLFRNHEAFENQLDLHGSI